MDVHGQLAPAVAPTNAEGVMAKLDWSRARALPPSEPRVVPAPWIRNGNGNLCRQISGHWTTVFKYNGRYRFVRNHTFSRATFATEREACEAACRSA